MSHSKIFQRNRALGYVSNHIPLVTRYINRRKENLIVTCTGRTFHTYGCSHFTLLSVSNPHTEDITCLSADSFHIYTASGNDIFAWRRGTELKHTYRGHESQVYHLLPFGAHLLSVDENCNLKIWDIKTEEMISEINFSNNVFKITAIMHPNTYINKILLGSEQGQMQLWNIKSKKLIHTFNGWNSSINVIEQAPAVDVIAVGLVNGKIILHNIKQDETLFELVQDWGLVTAISFRSDGNPIMATGTPQGHIILWNLENRKIESQITNAHYSNVSGLKFLPNEPLLVSSSADNTLKLWIFDMVDGAGRLLRIREGHAEPPTFIRFYGNDGHNILSTGGDSTLRIFSTVTEIFNKSLGRASYNRKASKKKSRFVEDPLIMPPITEFAAETTREKEWDNIAAMHLGLGTVTTWSYDKLKMGEHKLLPERIKFNLNANATSICLTQCGNFVIIGYNTGHIERFNIQSGAIRASYGSDSGAHKGPVKGLAVDCLNETVISAGMDGFVKFWAFKSKKDSTALEIPLGEGIEWLRSHKENSLIALALQDFTINVIDIDMKRIIRKFEGHTGKITDATFSPDSRWLVSSSMDGTIRVWDIPSSHMIDIFKVSEACVSLNFSPTGEFLATAHICNLGIYLWSNRTLYSHISLKAITADDKVPLISLPGSAVDTKQNENIVNSEDEEDIDKDEYISPAQLESKLITMSTLSTSRWLNLLNIDIIKKKNKPKDGLKVPESAPFFLPTIPSLQVQFDFSNEQNTIENSKLLTHPEFQNLTAFGQLLQQTISTEDFKATIEKLKSMGPSGIDLEIQSLSFDHNNESALQSQFLKMIKYMLKTKTDFELAQAYLSLFLKIHGPKIVEEKELTDALEEIENVQHKSWKVLREKLFYNLSIVQHLKKS